MQWWLRVVLLVCLGFSQAAAAEAGWWEHLFGSPSVAKESATALLPTPSELGLEALSESPVVSAPLFNGAASDYRLGAGDRLGITVFNEKELSIEARLSDAGTFSYPLLGEVRAQGQTIGQLQDYLTQRLRDGYLVNPKVYVAILDYRQFFVNGEVSKPGGYPFQPGLTVRKAISVAGGFTARASYSKIFVIHEGDPQARPRLTTLNSFLLPGDIITVEQSFF